MSRNKQCWACHAQYDMQCSHCPECGVSNSGTPLPAETPVDLQAVVDATPYAGSIAVRDRKVTSTEAVGAWNTLRTLTDAMEPALGQKIMGLVRTYAQLQYEVGLNDGLSDNDEFNLLRAKVREMEHRLMAPSQEELEPLRMGNAYRTLEGGIVKIVGLDHEGTSYETAIDQHGIHRYTQPSHQVGRVPGSPHDFSDPRNIAPLYARRENGRA